MCCIYIGLLFLCPFAQRKQIKRGLDLNQSKKDKCTKYRTMRGGSVSWPPPPCMYMYMSIPCFATFLRLKSYWISPGIPRSIPPRLHQRYYWWFFRSETKIGRKNPGGSPSDTHRLLADRSSKGFWSSKCRGEGQGLVHTLKLLVVSARRKKQIKKLCMYLDCIAWPYINSACRSVFGSQEILRGALHIALQSIFRALAQLPHLTSYNGVTSALRGDPSLYVCTTTSGLWPVTSSSLR